jgi:hypothetical protein
MLKVIRPIGHHLRGETMLAQSIGDGKVATLVIEGIGGKRLQSKFSQGITANVGFVVRKL